MDASSPLSPPRTVALVGLMGAGKSAIGKRLALKLGWPFVDADDEIERDSRLVVLEPEPQRVHFVDGEPVRRA